MELLLSIIELLQFINFPHPVAVLDWEIWNVSIRC